MGSTVHRWKSRGEDHSSSLGTAIAAETTEDPRIARARAHFEEARAARERGEHDLARAKASEAIETLLAEGEGADRTFRYPDAGRWPDMSMGAIARWWWRVRRGLRRIRKPYARSEVSRWETPVSDIDRILPVSLCDRDDRLVVTVEASWEPSRPRWRVTFSRYQAYRNADELHLTALWAWLDSTGQRCGSTFVVEHSPWIDELVSIRPLRHYVLSTLEDVIEVAAEVEPEWEELGPALAEPPLPGKSRHLWKGEDDAEIDQMVEQIKRRQKRHKTG